MRHCLKLLKKVEICCREKLLDLKRSNDGPEAAERQGRDSGETRGETGERQQKDKRPKSRYVRFREFKVAYLDSD